MPGWAEPAEVLTPLADPAPALWLVGRLCDGPPPPAIGSVVPSGYPAYVEVDFKAGDDDGTVVSGTHAVLASHTASGQEGFWAMWEGWPLLLRAPISPTLRIPDGFDLHLFAHPMSEVERLVEITDGDQTLWWPHDRSWVYARPVDSDALYVACDHPLAEALLSAGLPAEVRLVQPTDPMVDDL